MHSPETAMAAIQLGLGINCDNNVISTMLSTDLSAAYDTVDHKILTQKLEFYGIRDRELEIFKSFLSNRRQFVEIDGAKSKLMFLGNQSVIQGSKLAGILYTLYTNEIPDLHKLIHSNFYTALTKQPKLTFKNTTHLTINFVDDSTSIIGSKDFDIIQSYLETYYCLIKTFYDINKLKINHDINQVCIYAKSKQLNTKIKNFSFLADNYVIKIKSSIKILGVTLNNELKIGHHLNSLLSQCYNRVHSIKSLTKYTDIKTRLKFINAHMLSKLYYMMPLMSSAKLSEKQKVHKLIMFAARTILGSYCFKTSCKKILESINWMSANQIINWSILKSIQKIIFTKAPNSLFNYFKNNRRQCSIIVPKIYPKSKFSRDFYLFKGLELYNAFPNDIKKFNPKTFKTKGLKYFKSDFQVQ